MQQQSTKLLKLFFLHIHFLFFNYFFLLFKYSCLHFLPKLLPAPPTLTSHPQSYPNLLVLSMGPLYMFLDDPSPSFPHYPSLPSPLVTVSLFFISMSLVIFYLLVCFVDWVPLIGEIILYLSFTPWLISLRMILSRSMYAVRKGRKELLFIFGCIVFHCVNVPVF